MDSPCENNVISLFDDEECIEGYRDHVIEAAEKALERNSKVVKMAREYVKLQSEGKVVSIGSL